MNRRNFLITVAGTGTLATGVGAWAFFAKGDELATLKSEDRECQRSVAFSSDGTLLASAGNAGVITLWDSATRTLKATLKGHTKQIRAIAFQPQSRLLASVSDDHTVKLWDADSGQCVHTFQESTKAVECVAFSPDGKILAAGGADKQIHLWTMADKKDFRTIKGHPKHVHAIAFSPDGATLAAGGGEPQIRFWNVNTGVLAGSVSAAGAHTNAITFANEGKTLLAVGPTLHFWDVASKTEKVQPQGPSGLAMGVATKATQAITTHEDGVVRVWDSSTGNLLKTLKGHKGAVLAAAVSPTESLFATAGADGTVKLWANH